MKTLTQFSGGEGRAAIDARTRLVAEGVAPDAMADPLGAQAPKGGVKGGGANYVIDLQAGPARGGDHGGKRGGRPPGGGGARPFGGPRDGLRPAREERGPLPPGGEGWSLTRAPTPPGDRK